MATKRIRTGTVSVTGLAELNKELRAMDTGLQKELAQTNRGVAGFVADDARSAALSLGGVAAKVAPSIRAVGGVKSAGVGFGGAAFPYGAGAEFGAGHGIPRHRSSGAYQGYNQFKPWRGNGESAGYFVYPTIRRDAPRIENEYVKAVDALLKKAFPD